MSMPARDEPAHPIALGEGAGLIATSLVVLMLSSGISLCNCGPEPITSIAVHLFSQLDVIFQAESHINRD